MVNIRMDGRTLTAKEGETLLAVAQRNGIAIPTLCHHAAVEDAGACRLCMVEVSLPSWEGTDLVTACLYPVAEGLCVETRSEAVMASRRTTLDLLLARCPETPMVRRLAAEYGVYETTYAVREDPDHCILCGICTRICAALGHAAISIVSRGETKAVATPFGDTADACVGCAACARSCPTGAIEMIESGGRRTLWNQTFDLMTCTVCGRSHVTRKQMEHLMEIRDFDETYFEKCDACHRKEAAETYAGIVRWQSEE